MESDRTTAKPKPSREQPSIVSYASLQALRSKLGHILLDAGFITTDELQEALEIAKQSQVPTGRVLLSLRYLDETALQSALLAQSLIAEGVVDQTTATEALRLSHKDGIPFAQALELSESSRAIDDASELDELIVAAKLVDPTLYEEAKRNSKTNKIPLGRALVLSSGITFNHLNALLECVSLLRSSRISKEQAIGILIEMKRNNVEIDEAMKRTNMSPRTTISKLKLGDILTAGRFINERDNLAAVERSLMEKRLLGDVLIESGLVSKDLIQSALTLQNLAHRGVIAKADAVKALRKLTDEKKSFTVVAEELGLFKDDPTTADGLLDLIMKAGLARPDDVQSAMKQQEGLQMDPIKALVASGCISDLSYQAALDCIAMIKTKELGFDQSVIALQAADRNRSSLAETMNDLGMGKKPTVEQKVVVAAPDGERLMQGTADDEPNEENWTKVFESKLLIGNFLLASIAMVALLASPLDQWKPIGICVILFVVSINQFALGKTWQQLDAARKKEREERIETAKEGASRFRRK